MGWTPSPGRLLTARNGRSLSPFTHLLSSRSKLKAAAVMSKLAEVAPPQDYKIEEDEPVYEEPKAVPRWVEIG